MKKVLLAVVFALAISLLVTVGVSASRTKIEPNPITEITPAAAVKIDGNITANEGWSDPVYLNEQTAKYVYLNGDLAVVVTARFAYDSEGLYIACDVAEGPETQFRYSTGVDTEDWAHNQNIVGWNGDVVMLSLDPLGKYQQAGFITVVDHPSTYCFGLFDTEDGDQLRLYRTRNHDADITDSMTGVGKVTEGGWAFEAMIPWEVIEKDMYDVTAGRAVYEEGEIYHGGAEFLGAIYYMDRTFDEELDGTGPRGRYMTSNSIQNDGRISVLQIGEYSELFGLKLYIADEQPEFTDVAKDVWYYDSIAYCYTRSFMSGSSATTFSPDKTLTREQFVQVLFNIEKMDPADYAGETGFTDVPAGQWYSPAVKWALETGVSNGNGNGQFLLGQKVTREQVCVFVMNYAKSIHVNVTGRTTLKYADRASISSWATDAVNWMTYKGYLDSVAVNNKIQPKGSFTRAEFAVVVADFMGEYGLSIF